jgi:hypothetical protein
MKVISSSASSVGFEGCNVLANVSLKEENELSWRFQVLA